MRIGWRGELLKAVVLEQVGWRVCEHSERNGYEDLG
jgi:hypothetical protein